MGQRRSINASSRVGTEQARGTAKHWQLDQAIAGLALFRGRQNLKLSNFTLKLPLGLPNMMSASEGEGIMESGHSKRGCVNFILQISSKCGRGGLGQKIGIFFGHH